MNNVVFFSANALVMAISKFGTSAIYSEVSENTLPTSRLQARSQSELNAKLLGILGARHHIYDLEDIGNFLRGPDPLIIENNLFPILPKEILQRKQSQIKCLFYGADIYLAKFTPSTFSSGTKAWKEWFMWRKYLKSIPASSLLLYESRSEIKKLAGLPIEEINYKQLEVAVSTLEYSKEVYGVESLSKEYLVFGVDEKEYFLESNYDILRSALSASNLSNCDVYIKPHPNFSSDLHSIVEKIIQILDQVQVHKVCVVDRLIPLELIIYSRSCKHYFGVPSSALMAFPRERFTLLNPMPHKVELITRSYLNAGI